MAPRVQPVVTADELRARLDARPRVRLGNLPTPLDHCPRLSRAVGGPEIYIKRDDLTGLALGGNKTRNLEFLFGEALAEGADCAITGADTQSNHSRQVAAAAAKLGLDCYLVLAAGVHTERQGNLLLDHIFGALVQVVEGVDTFGVQRHIDRLVEGLRAQGRRPYRITSQYPEYAVKAVVGYLSGMLELEEQLQNLPTRPAAIVVCSGSATTHAGIAAVVASLGLPYRVIGISIKHPARVMQEKVASLVNRSAEVYDLPCHLAPEQVDVRDGYIGEGYGRVTPAGLEAIRLVARTEGILLDPVYTSKTMSGLIDLARKGELKAGEAVVFVHTGGIPSIFAYHQELLQ